MVKYALKIFGKNLQLMLDISYVITKNYLTFFKNKNIIAYERVAD